MLNLNNLNIVQYKIQLRLMLYVLLMLTSVIPRNVVADSFERVDVTVVDVNDGVMKVRVFDTTCHCTLGEYSVDGNSRVFIRESGKKIPAKPSRYLHWISFKADVFYDNESKKIIKMNRY